jgi:hypothetical protein
VVYSCFRGFGNVERSVELVGYGVASFMATGGAMHNYYVSVHSSTHKYSTPYTVPQYVSGTSLAGCYRCGTAATTTETGR